MNGAFAALATQAPAVLPPALRAPQNIALLRLASAGYSSVPVGSADVATWSPRILGDVELSQSAIDALGLGGRTALTVAAIDLADADGFSADLARYDLANGRAITIRTAEVLDPRATDVGTAHSGTSKVFAGTVTAIERAPKMRARIAVSDATDRLNTLLQPNLFAGTGGLEGQSDLKGRPKPVALGALFNVQPVYLGLHNLGAGSLPTYATHWRAIQAHTAIRIRGVAQTLVTGAPGVGQARDFPGSGCFQLGASPDGDVTADVQGDNVGGYVSSTATVLRRMLETLGGGFLSAEFDASAWSIADADLPGAIGFYQDATPTSVQAAAEAMLASCGAILSGDRQGRLRLCDPIPLDTAPQFEIPAAVILDLAPGVLPATLNPTPRAIEVQWRRNWFPLSNLAGSVTTADRQLLAGGASVAAATSSTITTRVALQRTLSFQGLYAAEADALARAERWRDWLQRGPQVVTFVTDRLLGQVEVGMLGRVTYPAYGLENGLFGFVAGWRETLNKRRIEITLVGWT